MERNFDKEKILDKMRALRDKRDIEILNQKLGKNANIHGKLPEEKVIDIKYLGQIDTIGDVFLVIEQKREENGKLIQIERYENEEGELIGGNNKSDNYDFILLSEKYKDKQQVLEQLQTLDRQGIFDLQEIEQGRLEKVAEALGVKTEELTRIAEIDAEKGIETNDKGKVNKEEQDDKKTTLSQKELESIPARTEIDVNQKVTDTQTISSLLKVQGKGYKKIQVVDSDKLRDGNSTRFSFVGIKEVEKADGSGEKIEIAEKIDTLEQRYGQSPSKEIDSLNRDGSRVEGKQVQSIYQIRGDNENQIGVNIGQGGTLEVSYIRTPRQNNAEAISIPIETHSVKTTTREVREFMNKNKNNDVQEESERIEQHRAAGCQNITVKDINDNPYDDTHTHEQETPEQDTQELVIQKAYLDKLVDEILENDEIASIYNRKDVEEKIIEYIEEKREIPEEDELVEHVENEMEEAAQSEHEHE